MLDHVFRRPSVRDRIRANPLGKWVPEYIAYLIARGHPTANHLLQSGVDITVIAIWLGHECTETTHMYVEANMAMKEKALSRIEEMPSPSLRFRADDDLLRFLEEL